MKDVYWVGTTLKDMRELPDEPRQDLGYSLDRLQRGLDALDAKPMKTVGEGVFELRARDQNGQYRLFYVSVTHDGIYVLNVFTKKTQQTPQKEITLAKRRLAEVRRKQ